MRCDSRSKFIGMSSGLVRACTKPPMAWAACKDSMDVRATASPSAFAASKPPSNAGLTSPTAPLT
jgi:hypothetical protein